MFAIRILGAIVAYSVVILEVYSGVINGPWWWAIFGALMIAFVFAMTMYTSDPSNGSGSVSLTQWVLIIVLSCGMSFGANYFGRVTVHDLVHNPVFPEISDAD